LRLLNVSTSNRLQNQFYRPTTAYVDAHYSDIMQAHALSFVAQPPSLDIPYARDHTSAIAFLLSNATQVRSIALVAHRTSHF